MQRITDKMISVLLIVAAAAFTGLLTHLPSAHCHPTIVRRSVDFSAPLTSPEYPSHPNEVLPIHPLLIFPTSTGNYKLSHQGRNLIDDDDKVIYIKLIKRKSYRPRITADGDGKEPKELTMRDIFYVKALANGQFSTQRLKVYRLPEFYAISVYRKGERSGGETK